MSLGVSWRANGKQLATCSADHKIKVWDFELGEQQRTIDAGGKEVTGVTFAGTGGRLVSSSGDRNVRIHNADNGAAIRTISGAAGYLFCCTTTETGNLIVAGGADRVLRVWNGEDGKEVFKIEPGTQRSPSKDLPVQFDRAHIVRGFACLEWQFRVTLPIELEV